MVSYIQQNYKLISIESLYTYIYTAIKKEFKHRKIIFNLYNIYTEIRKGFRHRRIISNLANT